MRLGSCGVFRELKYSSLYERNDGYHRPDSVQNDEAGPAVDDGSRQEYHTTGQVENIESVAVGRNPLELEQAERQQHQARPYQRR